MSVHNEPSPVDGQQPRHSIDHDAQEQVITSLRSQIQDLFTQVSQLNGKLVQSYNRVSDLEDELHVSSSQIRDSSLKISGLEFERTQHLAALNTGLLVEKTHVTAELNRLMEKATEEAAQRGQAESARIAIEKDLDDLSASLFNQANTMVAEARYGRALSERKVEQAELALKIAEEAVGMMQQQMQVLQAEREDAEQKVEDMQVAMGKGKWADKVLLPDKGSALGRHTRLLSSHVPYQEFLAFVANLRNVRLATPAPPTVPSLLQLPFLARLVIEDSDPTIRLEFAPSLNWLSRRSVSAAIHTGQLIIEPIPCSILINELITSRSSSHSISCALCGALIYSPSVDHSQRPPSHPLANSANNWSTTLFKKTSRQNSLQNTPSPSSSPVPHQSPPSTIYIFRLAPPSGSAASSVIIPQPSHASSSSSTTLLLKGTTNNGSTFSPTSSPGFSSTTFSTSSAPTHQHSSSASFTSYPLCTNGWCLTRLRMACTMWAFVRTGIIDKVWEEEIPTVMPSPIPSANSNGINGHGPVSSLSRTLSSVVSTSSLLSNTSTAVPTPPTIDVGPPPPVPPRRRGIWAAIGEKAASWGNGDDKKKKDPAPNTSAVPSTAMLVPPPAPLSTTTSKSSTASPSSPSVLFEVSSIASATAPTVVSTSLDASETTALDSEPLSLGASPNPAPTSVSASPAPTAPPLPRRGEGRGRSGTVSAPPPILSRRGTVSAGSAPPQAGIASSKPSPEVPTAPKPSAITEEDEEEEEEDTNGAEPAITIAAGDSRESVAADNFGEPFPASGGLTSGAVPAAAAAPAPAPAPAHAPPIPARRHIPPVTPERNKRPSSPATRARATSPPLPSSRPTSPSPFRSTASPGHSPSASISTSPPTRSRLVPSRPQSPRTPAGLRSSREIFTTALTMPLPESRPGTPGTPGLNGSMERQQQQQQQQQLEARRAVSPSPVRAPRTATPPPVPPRGASPAPGAAGAAGAAATASPPPVPRRAAARQVRPVSSQLLQGGVVGSPLQQEVVAAREAAAAADAEKAEKEKEKQREREREKEKEQSAQVKAVPMAATFSAATATTAGDESDVFVDASSEVVHPHYSNSNSNAAVAVTGAASEGGDHAKENGNANHKAEEEEEEEEEKEEKGRDGKMNGSALHATLAGDHHHGHHRDHDGISSLVKHTLENGHVSDDDDDNDNDNDNDASSVKGIYGEKAGKDEDGQGQGQGAEEKKHEDEKGDREVYVGDTTWEERTWREIVRLKEEMFWARIGVGKPAVEELAD